MSESNDNGPTPGQGLESTMSNETVTARSDWQKKHNRFAMC